LVNKNQMLGIGLIGIGALGIGYMLLRKPAITNGGNGGTVYMPLIVEVPTAIVTPQPNIMYNVLLGAPQTTIDMSGQALIGGGIPTAQPTTQQRTQPAVKPLTEYETRYPAYGETAPTTTQTTTETTAPPSWQDKPLLF
jgi:hypothetical protein